MITGSALGFAYLVRYEALACRRAHLRRDRSRLVVHASTETSKHGSSCRVRLLVYSIPAAAAFIGWTIVSYVITGHAFEQFQSQYGNSSQVGMQGVVAAKPTGISPPISLGSIQLLAYAPLLPLLIAAGRWPSRSSVETSEPAAFAVSPARSGSATSRWWPGWPCRTSATSSPPFPWAVCIAYLSVPACFRRERARV